MKTGREKLYRAAYDFHARHTPPPGLHNRAAWDAIGAEAARLASEHNNDPFLTDLLCAVVDEIERGSRLENAEQ